MIEAFDVIIIGAGQAGGPFAGACARKGWRTALVEAAHIGGTCVNAGCTPTKTMIASARVAHLARRAADYGVSASDVSVNLPVVRQRKRAMVRDWRSGSERHLQQDGVEIIMGLAQFVDPRTISVTLNEGGVRTLSAETVIINTGARPSTPDLPGLTDVPFLDSTSIMELGEVPDHLLVLGGGYVGLEFGQMFHRFGSRVTIVQRGERLLAREDADIADAVAAILREDGIEVILNSDARRVERNAGNSIVLTVTTPDGERTITGSHLLVATGRVPNSDRLNLAAAGVAVDRRGNITVDERLATNVPGIYAVGDVTGGPAFTHISYDDFRILKTNLLDGGDRTTQGRMVPYTVFIDPQLGRVGLSEEAARALGYEVRIATLPMSSVARAIEVGETRGFMKAVVDARTDQILGFAMLGIEGGEIMSAVQLAMQGGLTAATLHETVFAHPTLAESLNNLFARL
ncbi:mercuric reductase [Roseiflexus sp.]|uniref:mercuric reductase n=1 Tax=Roseiflexus sp. TaxID=2562120 RepID=UPI0021DE7075|nr:mercuric reductase [Roseiflexus sp.]GIW02046.1 MAG: mercuric reductase [Roseiflexus sp.]